MQIKLDVHVKLTYLFGSEAIEIMMHTNPPPPHTQVAKIMIPHLRFYFHEMVRAAAAEILPHLLECVKSKG